MKWNWLLAALCVASLSLAGCAKNQMFSDDHDDDSNGKEHSVKLDDLPKAVRDTLMKEAGAGRIEEIDKETENGKTEYEADVIMEGKKWEICIREDGQLLKKELDEQKDSEDETDDDD